MRLEILKERVIFMKKALLRLEDVGPGGLYSSLENLEKLKIIADYLHSENIYFQASIIPRYIDSEIGYDKSIADTDDPYIQVFNETIEYLSNVSGDSLGMHGYTHQYSRSISGNGFEFSYPNCIDNCPPDDSKKACEDRSAFSTSYASSRMRQGYVSFDESGLKLGWGYSIPHYIISENQQCILESWSGIFFQPYPETPFKKNMSILDKDSPFYRGVIYVPTPLGYVEGGKEEESVNRICNEVKTYSENDLASFFYHPYLEFPFIEITEEGVIYDDNSYLKRIIRCIKEEGFTFVPLISLVNFIPSVRATNLFEGDLYKFYVAKLDNVDVFYVWNPSVGYWYRIKSEIDKFPSRQPDAIHYPVLLLSDWAQGDYWTPLVGDFNGDGEDDVAVWDSYNGDWQVAIHKSSLLTPSIGRGDYSWLKPWAVGDYWIPLVGDFNGDGKDDIVVWNPYSGDWQVALSDGTKFIPSPGLGDYNWLTSWGEGTYWTPLVGDFNGDGKDDILIWDALSGNWRVALSDGTKFVPDPINNTNSWLRPWAVGTYWTPLVGDFNGDGKDDILVVIKDTGEWQIALSDGEKFIPNSNIFKPWAADSDMQPFVGDFDGDGKAGIVARHPFLRNGTVDGAASVVK
ncbi:MAG: DUF2334 domain-containing protein [Firmicutes bacterium]|nr:DUF2334 domain-containing protein [Bacillota bacterium]